MKILILEKWNLEILVLKKIFLILKKYFFLKLEFLEIRILNF